jgi:hypothetical protein
MAQSTIRYIFLITLVLVVVAYYAGSTKVISSLSQALNSLLLTSSGRNAQGNFAAYAANAPTA